MIKDDDATMRILFLAPLPPPTTGHSLVSQALLEHLGPMHEVTPVDLSIDSLSDGSITFKRLLAVFRVFCEVVRCRRRSNRFYLTISESVGGNIKDLLVYLLLAGRWSRLFLHVHGGSLGHQVLEPHPLLRRLNAAVFRRVGGIIILGESHRNIFSDFIPTHRLHIVQNFAQDFMFGTPDEVREKFSCTQPIRLLYLSTMCEKKGYLDVLDGYLGLPEESRQHIRLDFAGGFFNTAELVAFEARLEGLPNVTYHGVVDGKQKMDLFARAHLLCLPTRFSEGQPITIIEAYASGCVVLTTDHPGINDIFRDRVNGCYLAQASPKSITDVLSKCFSEPLVMIKMALHNRAMADSFRVDKCMKRIETILTDSENHRSLAGETNISQAKYQICSNCIMDTTDPNITFDERGWCDYCRNYYANILPNWHPNEQGKKELLKIIDKIKLDGKGKVHDCIIGLSGGPDSSYTAYIAKEKLGLRPLLFHVDAGWNNQQAVNNIEKLVDGLGLHLYTEVINWEEMKDFQVSFLKSQVPDQDFPQDIAFFSALYKFAIKYKIKYVLTGANISTECVREPEEWGAYVGIDNRLNKDIHDHFGKIPLSTFPMVDILKYKIYYRFVLGMQVVKILDYIPYIKKNAEQELSDRFGWQKFVHKHHESRFTRFFECYWLPKKFGFDKRRAHFSSLILTGQMTRDEALERISRPEIDEQTMSQEFVYVANKLDLSVDELQAIFEGENKACTDYKNKRFLIGIGSTAMKILGLEKKLFR